MKLRLQFLLLGISVLGSTQCKHVSPTQSSAKVVGGVADDNSFPATVGFTVLDTNGELLFWCTGTFVRDDLLLTAGHCACDAKAAKFVVYSKLAPLSQTRPTSTEYIKNPFYSGSSAPYDIAFIKFPKNTAPSNMIAKMTSANSKPTPGAAVTFVGYGSNTPISEWSPEGVRRIGHNTIYRNVEVEMPFSMIEVVTKGRPVSENNASTNHGDSGGPLYDESGVLIGTTASGIFDEATGAWTDRFVDLSDGQIARFVNGVLADKTSIMTISGPLDIPPVKLNPPPATESDPTKINPWVCIDNNGQGYGPMTNCNGQTGKCAKKAADLKEACYVWPNWNGRNICLKNGGRGFGDVFDCSGQRCAKADKELKIECLVPYVVHEN